MSNETKNYGLTKPLPEEFYDINIQNANMDIIDAELKTRATLDEHGKVLEEQLPDTTHIPITSEVPTDSDIWIDPDDEPDGTGGNSTMIVTVVNNKPSCTSEQIYTHAQAGDVVYLNLYGDIFTLVGCNDDSAFFMRMDAMNKEYFAVMIIGSDLFQSNGSFNGSSDSPSTMIVTVSGDKTSHTAKQIINHVKSGGMAVLKFLGGEGDRVCNFVSCDEEEERVTFIGVSYTEGSQYSECVVYGSSVESHKLKSVDDILTEGGAIFPTTHYEGTGEEYSSGDGWKWDGMMGLWFNIEEPFVEGKTYSVTINGESYTAVAEEGVFEDECQTLDLIVSDKLYFYYFTDGEYKEGFNALFCPNGLDGFDEWGEDGMLMPSFTLGIEAPTTIKNEYLDMNAIVAAVKAELGM